MRCAIVVARYNEDIRWMSYLGRRQDWDVFIYNDGPPLDTYFTPNFTIYKGDGVPAEASKYLQFMCDHYNSLDQYDWIVFTQADPFIHSPDFIGLLESKEHWEAPFQGLTNGAFPRYWREHSHDSQRMNNFRYFIEDLNDDWTGGDSDLRASCMIGAGSVSQFFSHYGAKLGCMKRCFSACFATTPAAIRGQTYETWNKLRVAGQRNFMVINDPMVWKGWVDTPNPYRERGMKLQMKPRRHMNIGKAFAFFLEFAWYPLLVHK